MIAGERIGKYEVIREIARGGMASVDLARNTETGQEVAIKTLPAHFNHDPKFRKAFAREAYTASQLKHEAIVEVLDYGEVDSMPYLVMPYMQGGTLADLIKERGTFTFNETIPILRRIASALDYAHKQKIVYRTSDRQGHPVEGRGTNIVHRDVKPANIYFDEHGQAYLGDFGIVWLIEATHSSNTLFAGTAAYMSPEQVNPGKPQEKRHPSIDGRADLYALGIILYEMLCGKVPYEGETPTQQLMSHLTQPVPKIRDRRPDIHKAVEKILMKVLAKRPEDRYATAGAFVDALEKLSVPTRLTSGTGHTGNRPPTIGNTGGFYDFPIQPRPRRWIPWVGGLATALCLMLTVTGVAAKLNLINLFRPIPAAALPVNPVAQAEATQSNPVIPSTGNEMDTPEPTSTTVPTYTPVPTRTSSPTPAPKQPVASDAAFEVTEDTAQQISLASFVSDPDGDLDLNSLRVVSGASHGRLDAQGGGNFTYTPERNYDRKDSFTYQVCDAGGRCAKASVSLQLIPVNDPPDVGNDTYSGPVDAMLVVNAPGVLGNDSDVDGPDRMIRVVSYPAKGDLNLRSDGSFTFRPATGQCERVQFVYEVNDGRGGIKTATVTLKIECPKCEITAYRVVPEPVRLVPHKISGDTDFDGNGPEVRIYLRLESASGDTRWNLTLRMHAWEKGGDGTAVDETKSIDGFIKIPSGYRVLRIQPSGLDTPYRIHYVDTDHDAEIFETRGVVRYFAVVGDTEGPEAGKYTSVQVEFRPIEFTIIQVGACINP